MRQWHRFMLAALACQLRPDRTGIGTHAAFGLRAEWDLQAGFPAVTTKKLAFSQVKAELAAFLRGAETLEEFHRYGCQIWDGNGESAYWVTRRRFAGDLGRIYGVQWRRYRGCLPDGGPAAEKDQLRDLVEGLRKDPFGRRHLVTAWNPAELDQMCLPPCHYAFQCFAERGPLQQTRLSLMVHMRSLDTFLGMPFDVASYALLTHLVAKELGWGVGRLVLTSGDTHVYSNHVPQVHEVLSRKPYKLPTLHLHKDAELFDFNPAHATLVGYVSHPAVAAPLNV